MCGPGTSICSGSKQQGCMWAGTKQLVDTIGVRDGFWRKQAMDWQAGVITVH